MLSLSDVLVVTGGIGSGKSTVAKLMGPRGWAVIDADRLGHTALELARVKVAERFPEAVKSGLVSRARLADEVFPDSEALADLERITFPVIRNLLLDEIDSAQPPIAVEVSAPSFLTQFVAEKLVVDCPGETRLKRTVARGMTSSDVASRMARQPSRAGWLEIANYVIDNQAGHAELEGAVSEFDRFWRNR